MRSITFCAAVAAAATVSHAAISTSVLAGGDAEFLSLTDGGSLEQAVAEGRIGNGATNGTWEMAIWDIGGSGTVQSQAQLAPVNGTAAPFTITYDGVSTLTYDVGGTSISWNNVAGPFTDIFVRTRSATDSTILLDDLAIDASPLSIDMVSSTGNGDVNYLRIRNMGDDFGAFSLTGTHTFSWTGTRPNNSALAYQFKFSNVVPTPGALAALALAAPVFRRRR